MASAFNLSAVSIDCKSFVIVYGPLCKSGHWIRVVDYLEKHEQPGQPIIAFISEVETLMAFYYDGPNQVVPLSSPQRLDHFDEADFVILDRRTLEAVWQPVLNHSCHATKLLFSKKSKIILVS